ncbi:hypothetical protein CRG98_039954, partial [Punica granatum]
MLVRASYNLVGSTHSCEFTFLLFKFAEPARSCLLQPCLFCSPVRVYFSASEIRRASSLVPLATLPGLLTRASLLFCFGNSPSQLARASCNLAGSAHPCEFTFLLRKFAEPARSCLLQPCRFAKPARSCLLQTCRFCSPVRAYVFASEIRRAISLLPLATLPGLLTRASLLFCLASSPSQLAGASCNLAGSAQPCEFTFLLSKIAEPARSCLLQPCRVYSPVRVYFSALQVRRASSLVPLATLPGLLTLRRACSLLPLATLPGLLTRASLLFCCASSSSMLVRASYNLAGSPHPCEFTFLLRKFTEPARSCLLQPCRVYSPLRESSPILLARASYNLAGCTHPCEFDFLLRKFTEPARSCLLQPCRICSAVRVYFSALQVRRASSLVPLATLPDLLSRASLLFCFASSPSQLARASYNLAGSPHPCEFTFLLRKIAEPARSCLLQPCRVCSPVRVYFSASEIRRAISLLPLTTLPVLLTRASLLFCFGNSPSHFATASYNLACSAHPLPSLLARASCNLAGSVDPYEFTFLLRKFAEPYRSNVFQPCQVCSPVRVYFSASEIRRASSLVPLATLPGPLTRASLLFCFGNSPSQLARASCNLAGSAHPCELNFLLQKFAEIYRSCRLQPCLVYSP